MPRMSKNHRNTILSPNLVLLFFASDFLRLFWVMSIFDIVAIPYLIERMMRRRIPGSMFRLPMVLFFLFLTLVLVSGMANPKYDIEHLILFLGTSLSVIKAIAFIYAVMELGEDAERPITVGFIAINTFLFLSFLAGIGFSGSGRFFGFFPQSNGMAAFQCFGVAAALYSFNRKNFKWAGVALSSAFLFLFLSGSRGALLFAILLLLMMLFRISISANGKVKFALIISSLVLTGFLASMSDSALLSISDTMEGSSYSGVRRVGNFITSFYRGDLSDVYQDSRGNLNDAAISYFLDNPTLLGFGYESSKDILNLGNRVHNIFLSSALEFGLLGLLFFILTFSLGLVEAFRGIFMSKGWAFYPLIFFAVWSQAFKTPYYFLNAVSWVVIMYPLLPLRFRRQDYWRQR